MAVYGVHYTITAQGKSGKLFVANILERNYIDDSVAIQPSVNPFIHNVLASSDDQFSPVLSSELIITVDITDFTDVLPDLTTRDDKKYLVTFYADSQLLFQGYLLTDSVTLNFTTGRKILELPCTDGIGMLKSILYQDLYSDAYPTSQDGAVMVDVNTYETLLQVILNCFNKLQLPQAYYLNVACNIYATGMVESDSSFSQILFYLRNWQNNDTSFMNCWAILEAICTSFGCQVFQAGGQYWIVNVGERDASTLRYFQYYYDGTVTISAGSLSVAKTIAPYDGTASHYFIRNEQTKIIRKGYPVINITDAFKYAPNFVNNGNLKRPAGSGTTDIYYGWQWAKYGVGTGIADAANFSGFNWIHMYVGTCLKITSTQISIASISAGDYLTLSFLIDGRSNPTTRPVVKISFKISNQAGDVYYLDNTDNNTTYDGTPSWVYVVPGVGTPKYTYINGRTTGVYESVTINMPYAPISGSVELIFIQDPTVTEVSCNFANVVLMAKSAFESRVVTGYYQRLSQYKKEISTTLGYDQGYNTSLAGAMIKENAAYPQWPLAWTNWYRYGYSETFGNVPRVLIQQYINVQSIAQINMEGSVSSIFDSSGFISLLNTIVFTDATYFYSVSGKSYATGNATFDYIDDSIRATWLQINNTEVTTETITDYTLQKL